MHFFISFFCKISLNLKLLKNAKNATRMKKKLFVDGRVFDSQYQGSRTYVQNIYQAIDKIGDFEIFLGSENPENTQTFYPEAININFIPYKTGNSKFNRGFVEIPSIVSKYKLKAAHFQYVISPLKNCLKIDTIHDILFKDFPEDFSFKYKFVKGITFYVSAKFCDLLITDSNNSKRAIAKHFNISENKIQVVPLGVPLINYLPYNKKIAQNYVYEKYKVTNYMLYVSRIEPRKNQLELIKAYLELKLYEQNKQLIFIGNNDIPVIQITKLMDTLPEEVRNKIRFFQNISDEDLLLFYQASELFIYPSKSEGFGLPPLEASSMRIPTICSNTTSMEDYTFFGKNHIKPELNSIKSAISEFYKNGVSENVLSAISEQIKFKYNWQAAGEHLNKLIFEKLN
jgi:glycosyltransferase involved in cell wall biosynthesis